jgi:protein deglycase
MTNKILVPLAEGFEEIEAVTIVDVLRRAELDVTLAGLDGAGPQRGSRGVLVQPDCAFADLEPGEFDVIVLPGGLGGTVRMLEEPRLLDALRELHARGGLTAAVCAAPMVLAEAGLISGVPVTSHPSVRDRLGDADVRSEPRVVCSGSIVTSQGPGTSLEFALALVAELCGADVAADLAKAMVTRA